MAGSSARNAIHFTGSGLLTCGGSFTGGSLIPLTGRVTFNNAGTQTIGIYAYNNLTLSGSGAVSINVVNMLGQHVIELFNGELKNGNHQLAFNNMILRSGIYFLTINTTEAGYKMQKIFMH